MGMVWYGNDWSIIDGIGCCDDGLVFGQRNDGRMGRESV